MINPMSTRPFTATVLALVLLSSAWAQTAKEQSAVTVAGAEPEQSTATRDRDTLSVDFPDEDIRTILRNVADLFELNLVVPDTLTGRSSIKLRDVTWRQIFQVVLSPVGYTFIEEGNIVKVLSQDSLAVEPVSTEVFILNNAKAADIRPTIEGLVDAAAGGRILVDARSNALVITERPTRMMRVRSIIEQLDKATAQVAIESKFVEVTDRDIRDLGVNWASLSGYTVGNQPSETVIRGGGNVPRNNDGELLPDIKLASTTFASVLSAPQFNVVLSALANRNNTKIVSNPTIVTLNNTEAFINIGQEFPIPSYTYNSERGTFEVSGFQYKPIGIILKVTPQVNNEGTIRMLLEPEVSQQTDQTSFGGAGGAQIPIIATRKVRTQISIKDGNTAAIGGLIQTSQQARNARVPVLGSIPGVGRLFSAKGKTDTGTNLIIFITARTVSPDGANPEQVISSDAIRAVNTDPHIEAHRIDYR
jgi:type IV pilus assembly protein PilQ